MNLLGFNPGGGQQLRSRLLRLNEILGNPLRIGIGFLCVWRLTGPSQGISKQQIAHVGGHKLHGVRELPGRKPKITVPLGQQPAVH